MCSELLESFFQKKNVVLRIVFLLALACVLSGGKVFATDSPSPIYRLWMPGPNDHFYTASLSEKNNAVINYGYTFEGVAFYGYDTQITGTVPVYRLWLPGITNDHFYTASLSEKNKAVSSFGYVYEGIAFYAYDTQVAGTSPIYRLWLPGSVSPISNDHFYTAVASERDNAVLFFGYNSENISFYAPIGTCQPNSGVGCYNFASGDENACNAALASKGCPGTCKVGSGCGLNNCGSPGPLCALLTPNACGNRNGDSVCFSANPASWGACMPTANCVIPDNGCASTTCTTATCNNGTSVVHGTKVCADNSCAANTCKTATCWNNLTWINGTKTCADNSCVATTCTFNTCWNNLNWISGTKPCDNGCAANTCTTDTCNNSISTVRGTRVCDNGCAANTCTTDTCNNGIATVHGTKTCDNGCAARTCTTTTCNNGLAIVSGTKICPPDNSCAALTCTDKTCANNLGDWIPGTLICTDNHCADNTCTTKTCNNTIAWVSGTVNCDPNCAANTCIGSTCDNGIDLLLQQGTKVCACTVADTCTTKTCNGVAGTKVCDPNCAANTCTTDTCDNGTAVIPGTKICICTVADTCTTKTCNGVAGTKVCDSNCATKTCVGQTCDNGTNPNTPGTKASVFVDTCVATGAEKTCTQADCERTIIKQRQACSKVDANGCNSPKACTTRLTCPAIRQTCPACSLTANPNGGTTEVAPQQRIEYNLIN